LRRKQSGHTATFGSGNDWIDGGAMAGEATKEAYVETAYHQPADEFDQARTFDLGDCMRWGATWPIRQYGRTGRAIRRFAWCGYIGCVHK
jgi:hypothetical protein